MGYGWMQLPKRDSELYSWARRMAPLFDRGPNAAFLHATSRQLYVGSGELAGVAKNGNLRDWKYSRSAMRGENSFRYREISPDRHAMVLVDLRDVALNYETKRLLSCALATAVLLSSTPNTKVTWGAFGADRLIPPIRLESVRPVRLLRGAANAMLHFGCDSLGSHIKKQQGVLRRHLACASEAHVVFVSHFIEPELLRGLPLLFGATVFLVEPSSDGIVNPRGNCVLGSALPPGLTGELNPTLSQTKTALQSRRCSCHVIQSDGSLLEIMTRQIETGAKMRRSG